MTTIVFKDGEFAWDSQTTWLRAHLGGTKVFKNGDVVFGVSGSARTSDILEFLSLPELDTYTPGFDTRKWIITQLVPAIMDGLSDVRALETEKGLADSGAAIILVVNGVSGYLSANGCFVVDDSGFLGIGSGSAYALGALKAGASVKEAVEIAVSLDMYSGGEVKTMKIGVVEND